MRAPRRRLLAIGLLLGVCAAPEIRAEVAPELDQFLCLRGAPTRHVDRALRFTPRLALPVRDHLNAAPLKIDLKKPLGLCVPAAAPGAVVHDADTHLEAYAARLSRTRPAQVRPAADVQRISNRFGVDDLKLKSLDAMLVPSAAAFDPPPGALSTPGTLDHFTCYAAERASGLRGLPASPSPLTLESAIGIVQYDARAPVRLCFPADQNGEAPPALEHAQALACYRAKLTRTRPPQPKPFPRQVATTNHFGSEQLTLSTILELCVPSQVRDASVTPTPQRTATPTPTVTPLPNFTLRVSPDTLTVNIGESAHFTATAVLENGDTRDFTQRVRWSSSTDTAVAPNTVGDRGRIDAVNAGSAVISVLDEATGVTSSTTGEDAILTVLWTLERIELLPITVTRGKGESVRLRATGHFTGGFTRPIEDRLVYSSSDPSVATPSTDPAEPSRIRGVAEGTATISATDPASGISSTASHDDVAMTVLPPLERCAIVHTDPLKLGVGTFYQLTAHGFYAGGFQRVVTQQVAWASDAPAIVEAPNTDGDRSRVLALSPGAAHITATDSITGIACAGSVPVEVDAPQGIYLRYSSEPVSHRPIRAPQFRRVRAIGSFGSPIFNEYITEKVIFTSSDPTILAAPNTLGDRGRLQGVGSGWASVTATDPGTGLVSQPLWFRVLDGLTRVIVQQNGYTTRGLSVGDTFFHRAVGAFADYNALLDGQDVIYVSDNPAVVEVTPAGFYWQLHALKPGVATISVIDKQTGISSDAFGDSLRVGVRGALQRIVLVPSSSTRLAGQGQTFGALAIYEGGFSDFITQQVVYSSSDETIAFPSNDYYVRGLVNSLEGGTAVINATDPVTGISSADSGEGATMHVVGPLQRLIVRPQNVTRSLGRSFSFTAIGRDAAGREINLTQHVFWASSKPSVARVPNDQGNLSRVDTVGLGTTQISAYYPSAGISSAESGDNATFVVSGVLESLTLAAEHTDLVVGQPIQLTATGHLVGGTTINLTQDVEYTSSNPAVAKAENPVGDRSRILTLAPGTAIISARDPGTGIVTTPSGTVTLTVTAP